MQSGRVHTGLSSFMKSPKVRNSKLTAPGVGITSARENTDGYHKWFLTWPSVPWHSYSPNEGSHPQ